MRFIGAMIARISSRPQRPATMIATSKETPMLNLAAVTASPIASVALSARS